ncbi:MAG: OmpP1/FadL family transporter, partial [Planctomycetota bacterium]
WGRSWIGPYHGSRSKLTSIDITPTVAWKINRCWSVGGSVSAMYAKAELGNAIDFGALLQQPQAVDGHVDVTGDDWGFGYGLGVLFEPSRRFRVGLNYRSRVTQNLTGDADFQVPGPALPISAVTGRFRDTDVEADIVFPDQLAVGCAWEVAPRWTLLASVAWTNWSLWRDLRVRFANPAEPDAVSRLDWEDTWRVALGATWRPNDRWTLRMGTQWDQSPIQDDTRSPRIPMNDRIWASLGAEYRISRSISVSGSYTHLFIAKGDIDQPSIEAGFLNGYVDGVADLFGLQLNWTF